MKTCVMQINQEAWMQLQVKGEFNETTTNTSYKSKLPQGGKQK